MKNNFKSQLSIVRRHVTNLSLGGLLGVTCLSGTVFSQDIAPGFAPQEAPAVRPFSFVPDANTASVTVGSKAESVFDSTASPGLQEVPVSIAPAADEAWEPPRTVTVQPLADEAWQPPKTPSTPTPVPAPVVPPSLPSTEANQDLSEPLRVPEATSFAPSVPAADDVSANQQAPEISEFQSSEIEADAMVEGGVETSDCIDESCEEFSSHGFAGGKNERAPLKNILSTAAYRLRGGEGVNAVGHLSFLSLGRDYRGDGRQLSSGVPNLFANDPDEGDFTGVDIGYGRRRSGGRGWEMRFLGFNPDAATDIAGSNPTAFWAGENNPLANPNTPVAAGLSGIGLGGSSMADVFNDAANHRVTRDSQFGSFEFNMLRASAGGSRFSCGNSLVEFTGGLRAVSFDESTSFIASATTTAGFPDSAAYISEVENDLFGLQIGGRLEKQFTKGWGYTFGTKVGIYNNRVQGRQRAEYRFSDGSVTAPQVLFGADAGRDFDFTGTDNELAFLGELDLGVIYQFSARARARVGYRGIAVTNIADAAGQFEDNLFDADAVAEPKAWGDLIVGGLYFGVDYAF